MAKKKRQDPDLLEIEDSEIVTDLGQYSIWLYGQPKSGKTSLASKFGNALFGMTEKGDKAQALKKVNLYNKDWPDYLKFPATVAASDHDLVVVDVLEKAVDCCFKHMQEETGIENPEGNEWNVLRDPFIQWVYDLLNLDDKGCILISHASTKEVKNTLGEKMDSIHPGLTGKPLSQIEGEVDMIVYLGYVQNHRVLQLIGDEYVMAGHRIEHAFIDTEGEKIKYVPMGGSASEAHENFLRAFENEQTPDHMAHLFPSRKDEDKPKKKLKRKKE